MDDRFLNQHRRDPEHGFANALRGRLRRLEEDEEAAPARVRWMPTLAAAAGVALVAGLFLVPAMRVAAQSVLDLFRVRTFAAVPFDASRMDRLRELAQQGDSSGDPIKLGVEKVETLKDPGPPRVYPTLEAGAAAARLERVRSAGWLPTGMAADTVRVQDEAAARFTLGTTKLRALFDALDLRDVQVPTQLDGQQITVRMSPALIQTYRGGTRRVQLLQAVSPEVTLPPGTDLAQLAEIGLRVLGLDRTEAQRIAHSLDWRSTLLVPVPANAASFRQVTVQGRPGLLILSSGMGAKGQRRREGSLLLWTEGDRVLALGGDLREMDLMQMAQSLR